MLSAEKLGLYQYQLQARDTDAYGQPCPEPSDLNPSAENFARSTAEHGRTTQLETRYIKWVQYSDVRPWLPRPPSKSAWDARRKKVPR